MDSTKHTAIYFYFNAISVNIKFWKIAFLCVIIIKMNLLYLFTFRVAMFFLLTYMGLFTRLKFSVAKTVLILSAVFAVTSAMDFIFIYYTKGGSFYLLSTLLTFLLLTGTELLISRKKSFHSVFTVLCATDFILPGNTVCYIIYNRTNDIFSSVLLQIVVQFVFLFFLVKFVSRYYKENDNDIIGWKSICLVPFLFYLSITCLSVWPMNLIEHSSAMPGVILLFALMVVTFTCGMRMYARKGMKQKQDMSLVFLAEYSDRIKNESAKVNEMSMKIEEMNSAMLTVTSEILNLLDNEHYDDIRTIISAIRSDSRLMVMERKCANNSINSVILEAEEYAKRSGVSITYNLNVPERLGSIEFEYAVVVERLLNLAIKSCCQFYTKQMTVSMYPSGAWMNIEMKAKVAELDSLNPEDKEESEKAEELIKKISESVDCSLSVPELSAFTKKHEVQTSVQVKMGVMISEFNVRIN